MQPWDAFSSVQPSVFLLLWLRACNLPDPHYVFPLGAPCSLRGAQLEARDERGLVWPFPTYCSPSPLSRYFSFPLHRRVIIVPSVAVRTWELGGLALASSVPLTCVPFLPTICLSSPLPQPFSSSRKLHFINVFFCSALFFSFYFQVVSFFFYTQNLCLLETAILSN